jgi:hypothetical protein
VGSAVGEGRRTRSPLNRPRPSSRHRLLHRFHPKPRSCRARISCRRPFFSTQSRTEEQHGLACPMAQECTQPRRHGLIHGTPRFPGGDWKRRQRSVRLRRHAVRGCSVGVAGGLPLEQADGLTPDSRQHARYDLVAAEPPPRGMVRHRVPARSRPSCLGTGQPGFTTPLGPVQTCLQAQTGQPRRWRRALWGNCASIVA